MTDELKMDLQTLKMRNLIYKKRFYKSYKATPEFFQMGEIVTTGNEMGDERLKRKEKKSTLAEQFLADDHNEGITDRKFVDITSKRRRMGHKKRYLKSVMKHKKKRN